MEKLIITLACTGNVPSKDLNPSTPVTAEEIVRDIKEGHALGVSVAHLHARDSTGRPTHSVEAYQTILNTLKAEKLNVITQLSTGARGGANTTRSRGQMLCLDCEMASLTTGSSNFPAAVNANSPQLIEALAARMYENNIKPEIEVFDVGMISNALGLLKRGILRAPLHFNLVMGVPGSVQGRPRNLIFMVESLPAASTWSVCGIGPSQVPMITMGILLGGHVRTGLEDTLLYRKGVPATNKMLVQRVRRIARELGREIATPEEARKILNLPGASPAYHGGYSHL